MSICDHLLMSDAETTWMAVCIFAWLVTTIGVPLAAVIYAICVWSDHELREQERKTRELFR